MKITFIIPGDQELQLKRHQLHQCRVFPPAGLAHMIDAIARTASTVIVDERIEPARHEQATDIVVIFINTYNQLRAYSLCKLYRSQGTYVVLVGQHLEQARFEARRLANTLLIGRGENTFSRFINDIKCNCANREYFETKSWEAGNCSVYGNNVFKLEFN